MCWNWKLKDNVKAHILQPDGTYEKQDRRGKPACEFSDGILQGSSGTVRKK